MPAITSIPNSYTVEFGSSWEIAYQQIRSLLRDAVDSMPGQGERMRDQIMQDADATEYNTRAGDTNYSDIDSDLWNVFPQPAEKADLIDEWDEAYLGRVVLPTSAVVQTHAAAISRQIDNKIVRAFTAAAYRGKQGTTASNFDTTNQRVAVDYKGPNVSAANTGLNFHKIARAARILDDAEVPEGDRYLGIRAAQMENLVSDVIDNHSTELSSIKMMPNSRVITEILGFRIIQTQRWLVADPVTVAGTDVASDIAWHKGAMQLVVWGDRNTRMDILPQKRHALAIRTNVNVGVTRKRDQGVVEILSDQSP